MMTASNLTNAYPLSPMQEGMLFHGIGNPGSGVNMEQIVIELPEALELSLFRKAWDALIQRHDIFRTRFVWQGVTTPIQIVEPEGVLDFQFHDWRQEAESLEAYLYKDRYRDFDLARPTLMRVVVFRMGEAQYRCLWTIHHLLVDGRSFLTAIQEMFSLYEAYCRGESLSLPVFAPFRGYPEWLSQQDFSKAERFWRRNLAGFSEAVPLWVDRPVNRASSGKKPHPQAMFRYRFSEATTGKLKEFAHNHQLTLSTLAQGALALVLSRYGGKNNVVFGAVRACRHTAPGSETMIGPLINSVPMRVQLDPSEPLLPWLKQLRAQWVELREFEHTPLAEIRKWCELPNTTPLFETLFMFDYAEVTHVLNRVYEQQQRTFQVLEQPNLPLNVVFFGERELSLRIEYDSQRFTQDTITRMADHLRVLLEKMVSTPEQRIGQVSLLTESERRKLLTWNQTQTSYPRQKTFVDLFEEQVQRVPEQLALVFEEAKESNLQCLTYRELNTLANQLARHLMTLGVKPDTLVGLCTERSPAFVIGLLGILKAGGAYVPLDPAYPQSRLQFMLEDSQLPVLLTQSHLVERFSEAKSQVVDLDGVHLARMSAGGMDLDGVDLDIERHGGFSENPIRQSEPHHLAYVIYTSGSTGKPKGVLINHQGFTNLSLFLAERFGVTSQSHVLQMSSLSFDASCSEIAISLPHGATLHLAASKKLMPSEDLTKLLSRHEITHVTFPPSVLAQLPCVPLPHLECIVVAGESCPPELIKLWIANGQRIVNGYGPTEATVCVTTAECHPADHPPLIGKPIANTQVYLLDASENLTPIGVPGELCIGGEGVARGYLNRPGLTQEKFVEIELHGERQRVYKTGDLACWQPDGNLRFLGRIDHQVKLRGFRVELGEIEATLTQHEVVQEAVVKVWQGRLAAYLTLSTTSESSLVARELRNWASERLPNYMVPAGYTVMEQLPLTPNGKIDRTALPEPDFTSSGSNSLAGAESLRTEIQIMLCQIWSTVLGRTVNDITTHFFEAGGHSLLATQLVSRIRGAFATEISMDEIFQHPILQDQATWLETQRNQNPLPPLNPASADDLLALSFAQERLWFLDQLVPNSAFYNMPWAFEIKGNLDVVALKNTFQEIIRRHESTRTSFTSHQGKPVLHITPDLVLDLPVIDLSAQNINLAVLPSIGASPEIQHWVSTEAQQTFDLTQAPLLRGKLLHLTPEHHVLLLTMHHIISDGWSVGVLNAEIAALYRAFIQGSASPLPEIAIHYRDFATWQRQWLNGAVQEAQLEYWRTQLRDLPVVDFPTDRPRPAVATYEGACQEVHFSSQLTQALKQLSLRHNASLNMTLLTGFSILLQRYCNQDDIVLGSPIANRIRQEIEPLIGFFVNTLVMRVDLSGNPSGETLLQRVKEMSLNAYRHQDIPFEQIVEELQPERDSSKNPLVQIMFALQNASMGQLGLEGLQVNPIQSDTIMVRFDIEFHLTESEDGIRGMVLYNTGLLDEATILRMVEHYHNLLEGLCTNPEQPISEIRMLSPQEEHQMVVEWNQTQREYPQASIHKIFENQVSQTPDSIALSYDGSQLRYDELNRRANRLAHALQRYGVQTGSVVGLCMERSLELIIAILGILKAGGVYLPLDSSFPDQRLQTMIADAQPELLITGPGGFLPEFSGRIIQVDSHDVEREPDHNLSQRSSLDQLAYINYTSGSTGTPKGIGIPHHGVVRLVFNQNYIDWDHTDRLIHCSNVSFDAATFEIWGALLHGGELVIVSKETALNPHAFHQILQGSGASIFLTVALFNHMIDAIPDAFASMKNVLVGGEVVSVDHIRRALINGAPQRFLNVYGPTEGTTFSTWYEVQLQDAEQVSIPIGYPVHNTTVYVLDPHLNPVPIGVPGELCIGGDGLAQGYLNQPQKTEQVFIPHPFSDTPGAKLYKTGDRVRFRANGAIEFLGRLDRQVKIRGFRIELTEIEHALQQDPRVNQAAVLVQQDPAGEKRLAAYLEWNRSVSFLQEDIQALIEKQVQSWEGIFDDHVYTSENQFEDPLFNTVGWNSSYDGAPIPLPEMKEWANDIVSQVLETQPRRVLELGCGTGMLLFRIAPHCESYEGWDLSQTSLDYIQQQIEVQQIQTKQNVYNQVALKKRMAHQLESLPDNSLDVIILSSVVQYFPHVNYLERVMEQSVRLLRPGGMIFLADLRNFQFMKTFHTSLCLFEAHAGSSTQTIRQQVALQLEKETEFFVDPRFFQTWATQYPQKIGNVRIRLQRGSQHNELTKFRYTAILQAVESQGSPSRIGKVVDNDANEIPRLSDQATVAEIQTYLETHQPETLSLPDLVNARLQQDLLSETLIYQPEGPETVKQLQRELEKVSSVAIDPEHLWQMAETIGYQAEIAWSEHQAGLMDATLIRKDVWQQYRSISRSIENPATAGVSPASKNLPDEQRFTNNPLQSKLSPQLIEAVKADLQQKLPDYMVPSFYVGMDAFPLTPTGKLDRASLVPVEITTLSTENYVAPQTEVEQKIADIWIQILGAEKVGVNNNFFEMGGHSLLATQVVSSIREVFEVEIRLRDFFDTPTIRGLSQHVESSRAANQNLANQNPANQSSAIQGPAMERLVRSTFCDLSFAQERLWFLTQLVPDSAFYNMPMVFQVEGFLDHEALEASFNEIIRRHDSLRTAFVSIDGTPQQKTVPELRLPLPVIRIEDNETEVKRRVLEEATALFDLQQAPLLRASLLQLGNERYVLMITMHHIISDGWSIATFNRELTDLYHAFHQGKPSPLEELPIQYPDYALWQRKWLMGDTLQTQVDYWKKQLKDLPILDLPTDHPRPSVASYQGALQSFQIPHKITAALQVLGNQEGVSLYMTLLAGFNVLMSRYTGQTDIVLGSPIANRTRKELEPLIGFFINTLVVRSDLSGDPSFVELLHRVRNVALEAYAHQDVPFEQLVQSLQPNRDLSRNPLVQITFALQNAPTEAIQLDGLTLKQVFPEKITVRSDMEVHVWEVEGELSGRIYYNTDLFDEETVARLSTHFQVLLEGIVHDPHCRISQLPMLTAAELQQLQRWNQTETPYPQQQTVVDLFETQVQREPDHLAVVFEGLHETQSLTFRELNIQANQLAHHLMSLEVGPDTLVGLYAERSIAFVVGILGILKAGGAYVPLDPAYPKARLQFMLDDSQVPVLLTQTHLRERLPSSKAYIVELDQDRVTDSGENPSRQSGPEHLAYMIYTSGSTGKPKGVLINHRGFTNLSCFQKDEFRITSKSHVLQASSLSFDATCWEFSMSLPHGATFHLTTSEKLIPSKELIDLLHRHQITHAAFPPSVLALLPRVPLPHLECLLVVGEPSSPELIENWISNGQRILNAYGPTEITVCATTFECQSGRQSPPIGKPIVNTQVYVVDHQQQLTPPGVAGELCIGGVGLARGYLNRPELTEEKFVEIEILGKSQKVYKTGDLVCWQPDGNLRFLGRIDHQVKLRGFRIELGEVEATLQQHPSVSQAVAVITDSGTNPLLSAYVTLDDSTSGVLNAGTVGLGNETLGDPEAIRNWLKDQLPEYMIPASITLLDRMPLQPNGKLDRKALPKPKPFRTKLAPANEVPVTGIEQKIAEVWQTVLETEHVGIHDNFFDLGGHSLLMAKVHSKLQPLFGDTLSMVDLFQYPTIHTLAQHMGDAASLSKDSIDSRQVAKSTSKPPAADTEVAIVGLAGRFPGASNVEVFWKNLCNGVESITVFSNEELIKAGIDPELVNDPNYVRASGFLEGIELFDAAFFGYSPKEAKTLDPQHRLFLQCAVEALEHAGYGADAHRGKVGVYAGNGVSTYFMNNLLPHAQLQETVGAFELSIANGNDHLATRTSYKLNLNGPAVTVQTACSTSLVAVHMACQSLRSGDCDIALAGGVTLSAQKSGYLYQPGMILSPDGHCRAFDANAEGTVAGNGVGIVVLKPLSQAVADHDTIYAVIKSSAINNDGSNKVGYTAPSVEGQASVIADAMQDIDYESIGYVEAHGTGTPLGDPIEIAALTQAYRVHTPKTGYCALGAVKTNIGHLDTAAGVAGLIKTALALHHKKRPPSLHFEQPNPKIDFANSPFFVNSELSDWPDHETPRRAAVSSFGIGGTNAHVVLEEAPQTENDLHNNVTPYNFPADASGELLVFSAKTPTALQRTFSNFATYFQENPETRLADVAYTLSVGRKALEYRHAVVCQSTAHAQEVLQRLSVELPDLARQDQTTRRVIFLFSGQGSQYEDMAWGLYQQEPKFREQVDRCAEILKSHLQMDLRSILYPRSEYAEKANNVSPLQQTEFAQPALFVIEYALAKLWMSWGVYPVAMLGYSIGEYVAACVAGVFPLETALALVAIRGQLMQALPEGAMLSVSFPPDELESHPDLSIAVHNGPSQCVVSGTLSAITSLENRLTAQSVECVRLHTSHAFHSPMMQPALESFGKQISQLFQQAVLQPPQIPYLSNVTGTWITAEQATDPDYWKNHLRQTVRLDEGLRTLFSQHSHVFLEVGPGRALTTLVNRHPLKTCDHVSFTSVRHPKDKTEDLLFLRSTLGQLWSAGVTVNWASVYEGPSRHRLALPTYPFEQQRYWIAPPTTMEATPPSPPINHKQPDRADWFYVPGWKFSVPLRAGVPNSTAKRSRHLLFLDTWGLGVRLSQQLGQEGHEVIRVSIGRHWAQTGPNDYALDPTKSEDYDTLFENLLARGWQPDTITHFWTIRPNISPIPKPAVSEWGSLEQTQFLGFYSLLFLAQTLGKQEASNTSSQHAASHTLGQQEPPENVKIVVVSDTLQNVTGEEKLNPEASTVLGPVQVIGQEYSNIACHHVDVVLPDSPSEINLQLLTSLYAELTVPTTDSLVAYRGTRRWVRSIESVRLEARPTSRLREKGVYWITGGLGGIGLTIAEQLATSFQAKLILTGRSPFPPREEWEAWLRSHESTDGISRKIQQFQNWETQGAEIWIASADVADLSQMQTVLSQATQRLGTVQGVIHCAGVPGGGVMQRKAQEVAAQVLAPKVQGTMNLHSLLQDVPLDFLVLCSSLNSVMTTFGQVDYCAANIFLDTYAHYLCSQGIPAISINWEGWQEVGMAVNTEGPQSFRESQRQSLKQTGLTPEEGIDVFCRALESSFPQVLVSTTDLERRLEASFSKQAPANPTKDSAVPIINAVGSHDTATHNGTNTKHPRPYLSNEYAEPRKPLEQTLVEIWQELLGIHPIGIHDDFFELGGDSLLGTRVATQVHKMYRAKLPMQVLFDKPTIAEVASHLETGGIPESTGSKRIEEEI